MKEECHGPMLLYNVREERVKRASFIILTINRDDSAKNLGKEDSIHVQGVNIDNKMASEALLVQLYLTVFLILHTD